MKAAVLYKGQRQLSIEDRPDLEPGPGQARIKVSYCGVCGSDLHITVKPSLILKSYPRIPGHEAAGIVDKIYGDGLNGLKPGDAVIIGAGTSCLKCRHCLKGQWNLCPEVGVLGFDADGAYAEQVLVPAAFLTPAPAGIPLEQAAILADAVSTPYHALKYRACLQPEETVCILGAGGLGYHAILLARLLGAQTVVAIDRDSGALEQARQAGADLCLNTLEEKNPQRFLKKIGLLLDVILDFTGWPALYLPLLRQLSSGGRVVLVGLSRAPLSLDLPSLLIARHQSILGSWGCDSRAIAELADLIQKGRLNLSSSISDIRPLERINQTLQDLAEKKGNPVRFLIRL